MKNIIIILLLSIGFSSYAQIALNDSNTITNLGERPELGKKISITDLTGTKLQKNNYKYTYKISDYRSLIFSFTIDKKGEINSPIELLAKAKDRKDKRLVITVKNEILTQIKTFRNNGDLLRHQTYKNNIVISKEFNEKNELTDETRKKNNEYIYRYFHYYKNQWKREDFIKGTTEIITDGKVEELIQTKRLPTGIKKVTKFFSKTATYKRVIIYDNGDKKSILQNNSYTIIEKLKDSELIKTYSKNGKLLNEEKVFYIIDVPQMD